MSKRVVSNASPQKSISSKKTKVDQLNRNVDAKSANSINKNNAFFSARQSGAFAGDFLKGIGKQTNGAIMELRTSDDPKVALGKVDAASFLEDDHFTLQLRDCGRCDGFSEEEIRSFISEHDGGTGDASYYINMNLHCLVRFHQLGTHTGSSQDNEFLQLPEDEQALLLSGNFLPIDTVYSMFVRRNSGKRSLLFRTSNFKLLRQKQDMEDKCSMYMDSLTGSLSSRKPPGRVFPLFLDGEWIGFVDREEEADDAFMASFQNPRLLEHISWFSPAIYKSLLQKCIRVRPVFVTHRGERFETLEVVRTCFLKLMQSAGGFVPDLQIFVSGGESAFKRLAVIVMEDAALAGDRADEILERVMEIQGLDEEEEDEEKVEDHERRGGNQDEGDNRAQGMIRSLFVAALCFREHRSGVKPF